MDAGSLEAGSLRAFKPGKEACSQGTNGVRSPRPALHSSCADLPAVAHRRRDLEEGGVDLMVKRELERVEERRVRQCVVVDCVPLSPSKKQ